MSKFFTLRNFIFLFLILANQVSTANSDGDSKTGILVENGDLKVTKYEALMMLEDMNHTQRNRMIAQPDKFEGLLVDYSIEKKKIQEAEKLEIEKQELIQWKFKKARNRILSDQLILQFREKITPPDNIKLLAREYYDTNPKEFTRKEKVKVSHILLSTSNAKDENSKDLVRAKLKDILEKINNKQITFDDAAKEYSDDKGSAKLGGVINYFARGRMVKPFEDAAFNLKNANDLSEITESKFGYHLIKMIDRKEAGLIPFEKVKNRLIEAETSKYIKAKTSAYSNSFTSTKDTTINVNSIRDVLSKAKNKTY